MKNRLSLKLLSLLMCVSLFFFVCAPVSIFAEEEGENTSVVQEQPSEEETQSEPQPEVKPQRAETKVKGVKTKLNLLNSEKAVMNISVRPSLKGRKVVLQCYKSETKKYEKIKTYKTDKAKTAKLRIVIPKKYREKTLSYWRIVVRKTDKAKQYVSPRITVTTMNVASAGVNADCACIYDIDTKQVIYGKNMHRAHKQASTTKIMTAVLLIESGKLGGTTKISSAVANTPYGNISMRAGDVYRNSDLIYSMMLPSSNESASAIAVGVSSSQSAFVKKMNKKAKKLGLENTHFSNPHGLDTKSNHTTAYDLVRLTAYASGYDEFMKVIGTSKYSFKTVNYKRSHTVYTKDALKSYSKRHLGGKTGTTSGAGCCFASVYKFKGHRYAVAVLGSSSDSNRWKDTKKLYKYINKYAKQTY